MFGASECAAYSQSQAQAAQAEGYVLGQQDTAYVFYGAHNPFTAAPQHEDPCFSTQDQGAPSPSSEENEFAMFAGGRAAQLGQQFRNQAFVHGFHFGLDDAVLQDDPGEYEEFLLWDLSPPANMPSIRCCMSLSQMLTSFLRLWARKTSIVFAGVDKVFLLSSTLPSAARILQGNFHGRSS
eukprot:1540714-Rhodomonas_salina.1